MNSQADFRYAGEELALFAGATNWKRYWSHQVIPYLRGDVLEVGAGLGSNTRHLRSPQQRRWVCLEPDHALLAQLKNNTADLSCEPRAGKLAHLPDGESFDAILYIDVLEHIEDDAAELQRAAQHLRIGGYLVVLSPAHPALFSAFDAALGHYRRYTKATLAAAAPPALRIEHTRYLDSGGCLLSLANRFLMQQSLPTEEQIRFWDRSVVPLSRVVDPLLGHSVGRSVLAVWRKTP